MLFQNRLTVSHNYPKTLTETKLPIHPPPQVVKNGRPSKEEIAHFLWISQFKIWYRRL